MIKSFGESIYEKLTGIKRNGLILSEKRRDEILYYAKRVRAKDYYFSIPIDNGANIYEKVLTTTANWDFILTSVSFSDSIYRRYGSWGFYKKFKLGLKFENFYPTSPLGSIAEDLNCIPSEFTICDGFSYDTGGVLDRHLVEPKNLFYYLGQRITIKAQIKAEPNNLYNGLTNVGILLTGIEVNLQDEGVD